MRLLLNEFHADQWKWRNDPQVLRFTRQSHPTFLQSHHGWIRSIRNNPRCRYFGVEVGEELVGYCGLSELTNDAVRNHGTAEYSMLIAPHHQGKGYGTEALSILLDYGFENEGLYLIWGEIISGNEGGLRLAQKAGFVQEATLRSRYFKENERKDSIIVSITRDEWLKQR